MNPVENALIIFIKNPEPGKVKTRLGAAIGDQKAYRVYKQLLAYTLKMTRKVEVTRQLWYSSFINHHDEWKPPVFQNYLQQGDDLGMRMKNAFARAFDEGFRRVVIIGSDCPDLTEGIIKKAFKNLETTDVVIGPSEDGGYYLLGMNEFIPALFEDINWSTDSVLEETRKKFKNLNLKSIMLPVLNDVDTADDLKKSGFTDA